MMGFSCPQTLEHFNINDKQIAASAARNMKNFLGKRGYLETLTYLLNSIINQLSFGWCKKKHWLTISFSSAHLDTTMGCERKTFHQAFPDQRDGSSIDWPTGSHCSALT